MTVSPGDAGLAARLPFPVALAYERAADETGGPAERHARALALGDALAGYCHSIAAAGLRVDPQGLDAQQEAAGLAGRVAALLAPVPVAMLPPEVAMVRAFLGAPHAGATAGEVLLRIAEWRDALPDSAAVALLTEAGLGLCATLLDMVAVRLVLLRGDTEDGAGTVELTGPEPPLPGPAGALALAVVRSGEEPAAPLALDPWMVLRRCSDCDALRVFLLVSASATGMEYSSPGCGHGLHIAATATGEPVTAIDEAADGGVRDADVQFTVYRRGVVRPGRWYTMLAFAHKTDPVDDPDRGRIDPVAEVRRMAAASLGEEAVSYHHTAVDSFESLPRGVELRFVPRVDGVEFNPPSSSFLWLEPVHREEFRLRASPELDGGRAGGRLDVMWGTILLAEVSLSFRVESGGATAEAAPATADALGTAGLEPVSARPYRRIFASYSHKDDAIVDQVAAFTRIHGDDFVRDQSHLRSGESWNQRIGELIAASDVFQLFWSSNALSSPFVQQEWTYALSLGREHFIRPFYWEDPMPARPEANLPPPELVQLHFHRLDLRSAPVVAPPPMPLATGAPAPPWSNPLATVASAPPPAMVPPPSGPPPAPPAPPRQRGIRFRRAGPIGGGLVAVGAAAAVLMAGHGVGSSPVAGVTSSLASSISAVPASSSAGTSTDVLPGPTPSVTSATADAAALCVSGTPATATVSVVVTVPGADRVDTVVLGSLLNGGPPAITPMSLVGAGAARNSFVYRGTLGPFSSAGTASWVVRVTDTRGDAADGTTMTTPVRAICP